jgi:hypothetical protein
VLKLHGLPSVWRFEIGLALTMPAESRRLEVRCGLRSKDQTRKNYVHMLNGTLCATERTMCCIVENYQTPEVCLLGVVSCPQP